MRHGKKFNSLSRTSEHRKAMLMNMSNSLIEHKRIVTTLAKAKALRPYLEPLITKAKDNNMHARRVVFDKLQSKNSIKELFGPILVAVDDRPGGYLRIVRMGYRKGDGAEMAMIEFVDFNETYNLKDGKVPGRKSTRRSRRSRGGGAAVTAEVSTQSTEEE